MALFKYTVIVFLACIVYMYMFPDFSEAPSQYWLKGIELLEYYGYHGEEHRIETDDGYLINVHRFANTSKTNGIPVVFVPPAHSCSESFFISGPSYDLVYKLHDMGLDVWLANYRGTCFAIPRPNMTYDEIYKFSYHEQGNLDVAAVIKYILQHTGHKQLQIYTGSMGNNIMLSLLSSQPEYNRMINKILLSAPVGHFSKLHERHLQILALFHYYTSTLLDYVAAASHKGHRTIAAYLFLQRPVPILPFSCWAFMEFIGVSLNGSAPEICMLFMASFGTGPYSGVIEHTVQNIQSGQFLKRDFGKVKNLEIYQQETPPEYILKNVEVPIKVYSSDGDAFMDDEARKVMLATIPNIKSAMHFERSFSHVNFFFDSIKYENFVADVIATLQTPSL